MLIENKAEITKEELIEILEHAVSIYIEFYDSNDKKYHKVDLTDNVFKFDNSIIDYNSRKEIAFICYNFLNIDNINTTKILTKALILPDEHHKTYEYYKETGISNNWFKIIE